MKLATFSAGGITGPGVVRGDHIAFLADLVEGAPSDMTDVIAAWDDLQPVVAQVPFGRAFSLAQATLLAPIQKPRIILAIGLNYADHVRETRQPTPERQIWFGKLPGTINGPTGHVAIPQASSEVDYEAEMVAVIGRIGRNIPREEAKDHVFGYCVGNDVSVRDWQRHTPQWLLGKSFDTHAPIGPWITTNDEIGDPHRLDISCTVNGQVRQSSNTRELIFSVWDQIAHVSKALTLQPGDLIFTGTPGGVGVAMQPPRFLKAGDVVRCEIAELGFIENRFEHEVRTREANVS